MVLQLLSSSDHTPPHVRSFTRWGRSHRVTVRSVTHVLDPSLDSIVKEYGSPQVLSALLRAGNGTRSTRDSRTTYESSFWAMLTLEWECQFFTRSTKRGDIGAAQRCARELGNS